MKPARPPFIKKEGGINSVTPEERAAFFERTTNYRLGYEDGKSAGVWIGRFQGLLTGVVLAATLAIARYLL